MERYIQFAVFFVIIFSIFGIIQWYVMRSYLRWLKNITTNTRYMLFKRVGFAVLLMANVIFLLRFPSTDMGWYQQPWFQSMIIYPGGIFLGAVILAFIVLLFINAGFWLFKKTKTLFSFLLRSPKPARGAEENVTGDIATSHSPNDNTEQHLTGTETSTEAHSQINKHLKKMDIYQKVPGTFSMSRRDFLKTTGTAMITAPVAFTIGASAATSHDYQIVHKSLYYPGLPNALNGLRIVHLSDIHSGIYMTETQMRDIFRLANEQYPDLVAITGDFVDNSTSEIPALYRAIPELKSEYGIFGCLGNHDHYASASSVTSALRQRDVQILSNTHNTLHIGGKQLSLLGVDDPMSGLTDEIRFESSSLDLPDESFKILLTHRPDMFDVSRKHDIDLTLAGHTHGGQIGMDLMGLPLYPIYLFQKYPKGLFDFDRHKLYVNVGIGMVGVPVRTVRPEMTVIELTNTTSAA